MTLEQILRKTLSLPAETPVADADAPGSLPGWDSLAQVRLLAAVEEAFRVRLDVRDLSRARTLGELKAVLREKGALR